jgi:metal-responsive CopG/Arc/MetJ family transcriptional regulator
MDTQNITLSVPKKVLRKFKEIAFRQQKSMSKLMVEMMEDAVQKEEGYRAARERHLRRLTAGIDLRTHGTVSWKRDDLHER